VRVNNVPSCPFFEEILKGLKLSIFNRIISSINEIPKKIRKKRE